MDNVYENVAYVPDDDAITIDSVQTPAVEHEQNPAPTGRSWNVYRDESLLTVSSKKPSVRFLNATISGGLTPGSPTPGASSVFSSAYRHQYSVTKAHRVRNHHRERCIVGGIVLLIVIVVAAIIGSVYFGVVQWKAKNLPNHGDNSDADSPVSPVTSTVPSYVEHDPRAIFLASMEITSMTWHTNFSDLTHSSSVQLGEVIIKQIDGIMHNSSVGSLYNGSTLLLFKRSDSSHIVVYTKMFFHTNQTSHSARNRRNVQSIKLSAGFLTALLKEGFRDGIDTRIGELTIDSNTVIVVSEWGLNVAPVVVNINIPVETVQTNKNNVINGSKLVTENTKSVPASINVTVTTNFTMQPLDNIGMFTDSTLSNQSDSSEFEQRMTGFSEDILEAEISTSTPRYVAHQHQNSTDYFTTHANYTSSTYNNNNNYTSDVFLEISETNASHRQQNLTDQPFKQPVYHTKYPTYNTTVSASSLNHSIREIIVSKTHNANSRTSKSPIEFVQAFQLIFARTVTRSSTPKPHQTILDLSNVLVSTNSSKSTNKTENALSPSTSKEPQATKATIDLSDVLLPMNSSKSSNESESSISLSTFKATKDTIDLPNILQPMNGSKSTNKSDSLVTPSTFKPTKDTINLPNILLPMDGSKSSNKSESSISTKPTKDTIDLPNILLPMNGSKSSNKSESSISTKPTKDTIDLSNILLTKYGSKSSNKSESSISLSTSKPTKVTIDRPNALLPINGSKSTNKSKSLASLSTSKPHKSSIYLSKAIVPISMNTSKASENVSESVSNLGYPELYSKITSIIKNSTNITTNMSDIVPRNMTKMNLSSNANQSLAHQITMYHHNVGSRYSGTTVRPHLSDPIGSINKVIGEIEKDNPSVTSEVGQTGNKTTEIMNVEESNSNEMLRTTNFLQSKWTTPFTEIEGVEIGTAGEEVEKMVLIQHDEKMAEGKKSTKKMVQKEEPEKESKGLEKEPEEEESEVRQNFFQNDEVNNSPNIASNSQNQEENSAKESSPSETSNVNDPVFPGMSLAEYYTILVKEYESKERPDITKTIQETTPFHPADFIDESNEKKSSSPLVEVGQLTTVAQQDHGDTEEVENHLKSDFHRGSFDSSDFDDIGLYDDGDFGASSDGDFGAFNDDDFTAFGAAFDRIDDEDSWI